MQLTIIKSIISEQHSADLPRFLPREQSIPIDTGKIISLVGPRRSGKTATLFNIMEELNKGKVKQRNMLYINFEDERLDLKQQDLDLVLQGFRELYPELDLSTCYFFFDEIQNIEGWDKFIRRIYDSITKQIFVTGSNAKLLSREIATALRGRSLSYEVLPLSFKEFCQFKDIKINLNQAQSLAAIKKALGEYLVYGGFPEIINYPPELKIKTLQEYFNVMMYRDIIERYEIKKVSLLKYFLKRLYRCITKQVSINQIYNECRSGGYKLNKNTLYDNLEACRNIYLISVLEKISPKLVHTEFGERKVFTIDNGLVNAINFKLSEDIGKNIEQLVYQQLKRTYGEVYFYKDIVECDFIVKKGIDVSIAIQVCHNLDDTDTYTREIRGLKAACTTYSLEQSIIITLNDEKELAEQDLTIKIVPLHKWLLGDEHSKPSGATII